MNTNPYDEAYPLQGHAPIDLNGDQNYIPAQTGLTKLEYFAGLAMQGLLANPDLRIKDKNMVAFYSVEYAIALIEQLNKTNL